MEISYCHQWLKVGNYTEGVEFYRIYGKNSVLKKLFASGSTPFTQKKLRLEIDKIALETPEKPSVAPSFVGNITIDRSKLCDSLKIEFDQLKSLIQRISHLNSRLDIIQNDPDRLICASEIIALVSKRRSILNRIDHFFATGEDLQPKKQIKIIQSRELSEDPELRWLQLKNELILARSQRTKLKNNLRRVSDYNTICTRIEEIEKLLKP